MRRYYTSRTDTFYKELITMATAITDAHEAQEALRGLFDAYGAGRKGAGPGEAGSGRAVFFGGAGVSTASGILDFRSEDGLYHQRFDYPPETMLSHDFYVGHPAEFFRFYREKMVAPDARPNRCHVKLAELEEAGLLGAVVTQNIDGLHQAAGSKRVLELHGSTHRNICQSCGAVYTADWVLAQGDKTPDGVPVCEKCGGRVKPDVVLYGESLDERTLMASVRAIAEADLLVVGGTSLVVYPAAGLIRYFQGDKLVIVNRDPTPQDGQADVLISCDIAQAFDF